MQQPHHLLSLSLMHMCTHTSMLKKTVQQWADLLLLQQPSLSTKSCDTGNIHVHLSHISTPSSLMSSRCICGIPQMWSATFQLLMEQVSCEWWQLLQKSWIFIQNQGFLLHNRKIWSLKKIPICILITNA